MEDDKRHEAQEERRSSGRVRGGQGLWRSGSGGGCAEHTFGAERGRVAGVVAIGLAFMLQREAREGLSPLPHAPASLQAPPTSA